MFWLHCGLFVLVIAVRGFISSLADTTSKRGNACLPYLSALSLSCLLACLSGLVAECIDGWSLIAPRVIDPIFSRVQSDRNLLKEVRPEFVRLEFFIK